LHAAVVGLFFHCSVTTGNESADGWGMCLQIKSIARYHGRNDEGPSIPQKKGTVY